MDTTASCTEQKKNADVDWIKNDKQIKKKLVYMYILYERKP